MSEEIKNEGTTINAEEKIEGATPVEATSGSGAAPTTEVAVTPAAALDAVRAKLNEYGVEAAAIESIIDDLGVENVDDLSALEVEDLTGAGVKLIKARKLVSDFKASVAKTSTHQPGADNRAVVQGQLEALLPDIPNDESWLNALKTGGILKVDDSSYIAAIRAALADRAGLYDVPAALVKAMEKFADETEEQVDPIFFKLRRSLTRRNYADIFSAIDGLDGAYITDARRKEFMGRIHETLWPAIAESFRILDGWYQTWCANFADPSMVLAALSGSLAAAGIGIVTPPSTDQLHDAGDSLVNSINRVFRGTGAQIAAAVAYDANTIRNTLENPSLPGMVGVKNRDLMLKKINANVSSNYVSLERNLVKYVLGFVKHDTVTSDVEVKYFTALRQLGAQINWAELNIQGSGGVSGLGGTDVL